MSGVQLSADIKAKPIILDKDLAAVLDIDMTGDGAKVPKKKEKKDESAKFDYARYNPNGTGGHNVRPVRGGQHNQIRTGTEAILRGRRGDIGGSIRKPV